MTDKKYKSLTNMLMVVGILIFIYFFLGKLISYFLPFIIGYFIAILIEPIIKVFHRQFRLPRGISSFFSLVIFVMVVGFFGNLIIGKLIDEFKTFMLNAPEYKEQFLTNMENWSYNIDKIIGDTRGTTKNLIIDNWGEISKKISNAITPGVTDGSLNLVTSLPSFLFFVIITLIATFFIGKDRNKIRVFLSKQIPIKWIDNFNLVRKALLEAFFGYLKAQLTLMIIVGIICTIGLVIIGNQYALLMGVIICVVDALPVFGSGTILIPWALFNAFSGDLYYALALGIIYAICILTRQFLEPKLIGDNIGVHPLATLMSIYIGLKIFGFFGIILGPLILIFLKTMQKMEVLPQWKT